MKASTFAVRLLLGVSALAFGAQSASAQDAQTGPAPATETAETADPANAGDIVVTAQRRSERLQDVPVSITALSSDTLQLRGISDPSDLARIVPGFSASESGLNTPIYTLRGIGFNETSLAATSTVSVYVDEIGFPFPATTRGATLDLSRVEVVKGPQGTLYGQNSTGGAINYISNQPTDELKAGILLDYGRFNRIAGEAYVSGPVSDTLKLRAAVRTDHADGWQVSQTRPDERNGKVAKTSARLTAVWDPASNLKVTIVGSGWIDRGETQAPQLRAVRAAIPSNVDPALVAFPIARDGDIRAADWDAASSDPNRPRFDRFKDDTFWNLSGRIDYEFSPQLSLTSITAYSSYSDESYNEYDGTPIPIFGFFTDGSIESFQQELRLSGDYDFASWVVGANYSSAITKARQNYITAQASTNRVNPGTGTGVLSAQNFTDQDFKTYSAFASADWKLTDDLTLTTGIRYTDYKVKSVGCSGDTGDSTLGPLIQGASDFIRANPEIAGFPAGTPAQAPLPNSFFQPAGLFSNGTCITFIDPRGDPAKIATPGLIIDELAENNVSWRAALNYKIDRDRLIYASISRGFKSGLFPNVAATSYVQYGAVAQERLTSYEAGAKTSWGNGVFQANGAVFYYDYKDKQQRGTFLDPVFAALSRLVNVPKSHVFGAELETTLRPADGLRLSGAVTYLKTRIDEYQGLDVLGVATDYEGAVLSFAPEWSFDLDAEYRHSFGNLEGFAGASYARRSSASAVNGEDPLLALPAYGLLGLRAGVGDADDGWQVTVYGENVTNEYYLNNVLAQFDTLKGYVGMPATYGVRLNFNF